MSTAAADSDLVLCPSVCLTLRRISLSLFPHVSFIYNTQTSSRCHETAIDIWVVTAASSPCVSVTAPQATTVTSVARAASSGRRCAKRPFYIGLLRPSAFTARVRRIALSPVLPLFMGFKSTKSKRALGNKERSKALRDVNYIVWLVSNYIKLVCFHSSCRLKDVALLYLHAIECVGKQWNIYPSSTFTQDFVYFRWQGNRLDLYIKIALGFNGLRFELRISVSFFLRHIYLFF